MIPFVKTDGGRRAAGFTNEKTASDCVARAVAIASNRPYIEVYAELAEMNRRMPLTKNRSRRAAAGKMTASHGIYTKSKLFKDYMKLNGFEWTATMRIGSGCLMHVKANELPPGRLVLRLSRHCAAVIDGVLYDAYDCSRDGTRAVYGYWRLKDVPG
jgi:hypothetical protein